MLTPPERQHCSLLLGSCCTLPDSAAASLHAALCVCETAIFQAGICRGPQSAF